MDFMKMWFNLKEELNKKNSWGKNELKNLMESIEIDANQTYLKVYTDTDCDNERYKEMVKKLKREIEDKSYFLGKKLIKEGK